MNFIWKLTVNIIYRYGDMQQSHKAYVISMWEDRDIKQNTMNQMKGLTSSAKGFQYSEMAGVLTRWGSVKAFWTCQQRQWAKSDDLKKFHDLCCGIKFLDNTKEHKCYSFHCILCFLLTDSTSNQLSSI